MPEGDTYQAESLAARKKSLTPPEDGSPGRVLAFQRHAAKGFLPEVTERMLATSVTRLTLLLS
eukprot:12921456-Prorocentrum_lima.AAC.1